MFEDILPELRILLDILLSALLGFLIGLERKFRFKEAGIRTHTILCVGSALMMVVSMYAFGDGSDAGRVAAQIVSGIGFLGAGIIIYRKQEVKGLTTAAGVWATAGIGMACGGRLYIVAIGTTAILIIAQCIFHMRPFKNKKYYFVNIKFLQTENASLKIKELFGIERFNKLNMSRDGDKIIYSATLNTSKELSSFELSEIMEQNTFIYSIERCDE